MKAETKASSNITWAGAAHRASATNAVLAPSVVRMRSPEATRVKAVGALSTVVVAGPVAVADALSNPAFSDDARTQLSGFANGHRLRLSPATSGTDGFFAALYERAG